MKIRLATGPYYDEPAQMMRICVCQMGARMHYGVARACEQRGSLAHLYTDIAATGRLSRALRAIPTAVRPSVLSRFLGRLPPEVPESRITAFTKLGLQNYWRLARAKNGSDQTGVHLLFARRLCVLAHRTGFKGASHLYAFSGAGYEFLKAGKDAGLRTILEQPAMPKEVQDSLLAPEYEEYVDWENATALDHHHHEFLERQWAEWKLADTIIAPSHCVLRALEVAGAPVERCAVVPYGVDSSFVVNHQPHSGPLRVLTVAALRLLKGPQYTMIAAKMLKGTVEVRLVGASSLYPLAHRELSAHMHLIGQVPRSEIRKHYEWADVFLLPSLCEGMATVLIEALSAGLPIVTTANAGLAVRDGVDGFLVPIRDPDAIAAKLDEFASSPALLREMSSNAKQRAAEFTLEAYGDRLFSALDGASLLRSCGGRLRPSSDS